MEIAPQATLQLGSLQLEPRSGPPYRSPRFEFPTTPAPPQFRPCKVRVSFPRDRSPDSAALPALRQTSPTSAQRFAYSSRERLPLCPSGIPLQQRDPPPVDLLPSHAL